MLDDVLALADSAVCLLDGVVALWSARICSLLLFVGLIALCRAVLAVDAYIHARIYDKRRTKTPK